MSESFTYISLAAVLVSAIALFFLPLLISLVLVGIGCTFVYSSIYPSSSPPSGEEKHAGGEKKETDHAVAGIRDNEVSMHPL